MSNLVLEIIGERLPKPVFSTGNRLGSQDRGRAICPNEGCSYWSLLSVGETRKARQEGLEPGDLGECPWCTPDE